MYDGARLLIRSVYGIRGRIIHRGCALRSSGPGSAEPEKIETSEKRMQPETGDWKLLESC